MKINYINISTTDVENNLPVCQCGSQLEYSDKLQKFVCSNPDCIKTRMQSVMSTLRALDKIAKEKGFTVSLLTTAKDDYDRLTAYIEACDIECGAELITSGNSLDELGALGTQLCTLIDNMTFELDELVSICGSTLLEKFNIEITKLSTNQRQSVVEINNQLGIDGTIWLAQMIYTEYIMLKPQISKLIDYLTLVRPARLKRSTNPVAISYMNVDSLFDELQEIDMIDDNLYSDALNNTDNSNDNDNTESIEEADNDEADDAMLEELLDW